MLDVEREHLGLCLPTGAAPNAGTWRCGVTHPLPGSARHHRQRAWKARPPRSAAAESLWNYNAGALDVDCYDWSLNAVRRACANFPEDVHGTSYGPYTVNRIRPGQRASG